MAQRCTSAHKYNFYIAYLSIILTTPFLLTILCTIKQKDKYIINLGGRRRQGRYLSYGGYTVRERQANS